MNTRKRLKQYTRMLYGVKLVSEIFQRFIENCLADILNTVVKIDSNLVSGKSDREHLENIESV